VAELGGNSDDAYKPWVNKSQAMARMRQGLPAVSAEPSKGRTFKRKKTYSTIMMVHNMLKNATMEGLEAFKEPVNADGSRPDPFTWRGLDLALDMASPNVSMDTFLNLKIRLNFNSNWDLSHGAHNDGAKKVLKENGLWPHVAIMSSAQNLWYGCMLSPPRLKQAQQTTQEYLQTADPNTDPWFLVHMPYIISQLQLGLSPADPGTPEVVWQRLQGMQDLHAKGKKVNLGDYMAPITAARTDIKSFSLKSLILGVCCYRLGLKTVPRRKADPKAKAKAKAAPTALAITDDDHLAIVPVGVAKDDTDVTTRKAAFHMQGSAVKGNQLERAFQAYSNFANHFKQRIICNCLGYMELWQGKMNQELRSCDAVVDWELKMLRGEIYDHLRMTCVVMSSPRLFAEMGVEVDWSAQASIATDDARVEESDQYAQLIWGVCSSTICARAERLLLMTEGYPRVLVKCLDPDMREECIANFRQDIEQYAVLLNVERPWVDV